MMFGSIKGGDLRNIIWSNQRTESFVYRWQHAHVMFDITCFPAFV